MGEPVPLECNIVHCAEQECDVRHGLGSDKNCNVVYGLNKNAMLCTA